MNDQRRFRPRLPKDGYYLIAGESEPSPASAGKGFDRFLFHPGEMKKTWDSDVEVLTFHNWFMSRFRISEVDEDKRQVTFTGHTASKDKGWGGLNRGWRFIIENVPEALEKPGEWYLDRKSGLLTYIPMPGETPETAEVIAPKAEKIIEFKGGDYATKKFVEHLRFEDISFEHTNWKLSPTGYSFPQAEAILGGAVGGLGLRNSAFERCGFKHHGIYALDFSTACRDVKVTNCAFVDMGAGGVKIGEMKSNKEEDENASNVTISNNAFAFGGRVHRLRLASGSGSRRTMFSSTTMCATFIIPRFRWAGRGATAKAARTTIRLPTTIFKSSARVC